MVVLRRVMRVVAPFDAAGLLDFLGRRAVPGIEAVDGSTYRRSLRLPGGPAVVALRLGADRVDAVLRLSDPADAAEAARRCHHLLDVGADPAAVAATLRADPALRRSVGAHPGLRSPGAAEPEELAVRAVLGQQVTVAAARTLAGRLVAALGDPLPAGLAQPGVDRAFPTPSVIAQAPDAVLAMPAARRRAVRALAAALVDGVPPEPVLLALPGVGTWTAAYIAMRIRADRDAFLPTDLGVRAGAAALGLPTDPRDLLARAERWRPYRAYAVHHLWRAIPPRP